MAGLLVHSVAEELAAGHHQAVHVVQLLAVLAVARQQNDEDGEATAAFWSTTQPPVNLSTLSAAT